MVITLGFSKIISHSRGVLFKGGICSLCLLVKEKICSPDVLLRASICSEQILSFTSWLALERRGRQNENEVAPLNLYAFTIMFVIFSTVFPVLVWPQASSTVFRHFF